MNAVITNQKIEIEAPYRIVSGSVDEYLISFVFDASWDNYVKFVVFDNFKTTKEIMLLNNECVIPWEILIDEGYFRFGCYGVNNNYTKPTIYSPNIPIYKGVKKTDAAKPSTPDLYGQLMNYITGLKNIYDPKIKEIDCFDSKNHDYDNTDSTLESIDVNSALSELDIKKLEEETDPIFTQAAPFLALKSEIPVKPNPKVFEFTVDTPYGKPFLFTSPSTFTLENHGYTEGTLVELYGILSSTVFNINTTYYVKFIDTSNFQLSEINGGVALVDSEFVYSNASVCAMPSSSGTVVTMPGHGFVNNQIVEISLGRGTKPTSLSVMTTTGVDTSEVGKFSPFHNKALGYVRLASASTFEISLARAGTTSVSFGTGVANGWRVRVAGVRNISISELNLFGHGYKYKLTICGAASRGSEIQDGTSNMMLMRRLQTNTIKKYWSNMNTGGIWINTRDGFVMASNSYSTRFYSMFVLKAQFDYVDTIGRLLMDTVISESQGASITQIMSSGGNAAGTGWEEDSENLTSLFISNSGNFLNGTHFLIERED